MQRRCALYVIAALCSLVVSGCGVAEQVAAFIDSISDGAACASDADCFSGTCLGPDQGYPNGYCTTLECDTQGCTGFGSECFRTEIEGVPQAACFELCDSGGACDRAADGYACVNFQDTPVCLPPGATSAPVQGAIGSSCAATAQCNGEGGACLTNLFGGYCAILGCDPALSESCPDQEPCVALDPQAESEAEKRYACMKGCASDDDCRFGYTCADYEGARICLEGERRSVRNPEGADDGAPCVASINCKGGTCIRQGESAEGDEPSWPGGYCTTRDCDDAAQCNVAGAVCIARNAQTSCRAGCQGDDDCRAGYVCRIGEEGQPYCDTRAPAAVTPVDTEPGSIQIECGPSKSLSFEVPEGSEGFFFAPFTTEEERVDLEELTFPDGSTLDLDRGYEFATINADILGNLSPVLFPATDAAPLRDRFVPGRYTMRVATSASEVCHYVVGQPGEGQTVRLALYFVGVPGVSASGAASNRSIQAMVGLMRRIYAEVGVGVEVAEYIEASEAVRERYQIVRDFYDIFNLVSTSEAPAGDELRVNVFLIEDFAIADAPGLLGVSSGLPGMVGVHGSKGSGLVFSAATLGEADLSLGQTLAHEVGHFLGLRHTSERLGSGEDPITDTPSCVAPDLAFICEDATNFMFPFSLGGDDQTRITPGQGFVLRRNPLVRP